MSAQSPLRVLYIDDDEGLRRLVRRDLERHGYVVETAENGAEGVNRIRAGGIDVVGLDHYMPGQDGLETLDAIRQLEDPPPVVYVTGAQESRVAVAALKAGAADYVVKEVDQDFLTLLRTAFANAVQAREMRRWREQAEEEVRRARDRFEALAAERALLLREVNHRVGNSLQLIASLLHMQASVASQPETKSALGTAVGRVAAVAQVHRRLYTSDDVQSVALDQYLDALVGDLRKSTNVAGAGAQLTLDAEPMPVHPDRAVALGMLVTELVINAQKYAYPDGGGPIRVTLKRNGAETAQLAVEDDGVGSAGESKGGGLGRRIIEAMAQKLSANITRDPNHRGTRIVMDFDLVDRAPEMRNAAGA